MRRLMDVLQHLVRSLFKGLSVDRDLDRELRFHLEQQVAELVASGMPADEARREALRQFGSVASISEQCRDTRRVSFVSHLAQDLKYAARGLVRQPMLFVAATSSIALGVGANLAIFGLANSLLLATPTAFRADRLAHIRTGNGSHAPYRAWQLLNESAVLDGIAGHQIEAEVNWRGPELSVPIAPLLVTPNFFDVVGVPMALGRGFTAGELTAGSDARRAVPSYVHRRVTLRNLLVTGQIAISVLLLVTTLLFVRNLALAHTLAPGFDATQTLAARLTFVEGRQGPGGSPSVEGMVRRLAALPGVDAAAFADGLPLTIYTSRTGTELKIEGFEAPVRVSYEGNAVGPGYFRAMGIHILRGREFDWTDRRGSTLKVIVNQEFVRRYFGGRDPIGLHIFLPTDPQPTPAEVIGIAADSKYRTIGEDREPSLYEAYLQRSAADRYVHVIVRTAGAPQALMAAVRQTILQVDGSAAVTVEPMTTAVAFAFLPSRIGATLVGLLGAALAMVGLYGVVSFAVTTRTFEIGLRMALGATPRAIARLILWQGSVLVGAGLAIGLALALVVTRPLAAFLVADLPARDPVSLAGGAILLAVTSLAAAWGPARRAARVAPTTALRVD